MQLLCLGLVTDHLFFFLEIYYTESLYRVYKDKLQNCSVTNLNKYLHYGTSGTEYSDTSANEDNSFRNHIR